MHNRFILVRVILKFKFQLLIYSTTLYVIHFYLLVRWRNNGGQLLDSNRVYFNLPSMTSPVNFLFRTCFMTDWSTLVSTDHWISSSVSQWINQWKCPILATELITSKAYDRRGTQCDIEWFSELNSSIVGCNIS